MTEERSAPAVAASRPAGAGGRQLPPGMVWAQALGSFTVMLCYIMLRRHYHPQEAKEVLDELRRDADVLA
eukprot:175725-Alexandrium_andersonii.AAC.1